MRGSQSSWLIWYLTKSGNNLIHSCFLSLSLFSLLSHSAVVARELGLPTIVGVSGGLMKRLKTGMRVHVDAGKGRVTILREEH